MAWGLEIFQISRFPGPEAADIYYIMYIRGEYGDAGTAEGPDISREHRNHESPGRNNTFPLTTDQNNHPDLYNFYKKRRGGWQDDFDLINSIHRSVRIFAAVEKVIVPGVQRRIPGIFVATWSKNFCEFLGFFYFFAFYHR